MTTRTSPRPPRRAVEDEDDATTTSGARDDVSDVSVGSLDDDAREVSPSARDDDDDDDDDDDEDDADATARDARSRMNGRASSSSFSATTKTIRGAATKTMETIGRVAVEAHGLGQSLVGETVAMLERATVRGTPSTTPADAERD